VTVADDLVDRLAAWGVRRIYGYPGDGINGVMGALARAQDRIDLVEPRHEEAAAFMACGHAKFTGQVGVCLATSGPGAVHLINGLYDAKADHQPVVAIVGQKPRAALGGHFQQEVDLVALFKDVAHEYVHMVTAPAQLRHVVDRAFRIALAERAPTCIVLPQDIQEAKAENPKHVHGTIHSGAGYTPPRVIPEDADLARAAEVLNAGKRVAILIGAGAAGAAKHLIEVAEMLGAGIAKALLGKPVLPDDIPFVTGGIGFLGTRPSYEMMQRCDTLLMVGSGFPYGEFLPEEGAARGVQIEIDARMLSLRYPMEVPLVGDSAETLRALLPLLRRNEDRSFRQEIERNVAQWRETLRHHRDEQSRPQHGHVGAAHPGGRSQIPALAGGSRFSVRRLRALARPHGATPGRSGGDRRFARPGARVDPPVPARGDLRSRDAAPAAARVACASAQLPHGDCEGRPERGPDGARDDPRALRMKKGTYPITRPVPFSVTI
jgi:pyruvate dehydrogenase (quinone)